jgi:hypothetical protein
MRGLRASISTDVATRSVFSSVSANAELREAKLDGNPAVTAQLPPGLHWQGFSERCFPNGKRHDLNAVVVYFAYQGFGAELHRTRRPAKQSMSGKRRAARRCKPPKSRRDGKMIGRARRPSSRSGGTPPQTRCRDEVVADHSRRLARSAPTADRPAHYFGGGRSRKTATSDPSQARPEPIPARPVPLNTGREGRTQ